MVHALSSSGEATPVWGLKWHKTLFVRILCRRRSSSVLGGVSRKASFHARVFLLHLVTHRDVKWDFSPHVLSSLEVEQVELMSGEPKSVGAGRRATVGVLHSSWFGFMRSFAQIVYSSLGFELESGFWKLIKAADNQYLPSLRPSREMRDCGLSSLFHSRGKKTLSETVLPLWETK